jgi:molecular chaperone GrpE
MSNKDSSLNDDRENVETDDINLNNNENKETRKNEEQAAFDKIDELKERLEKQEKKSKEELDKLQHTVAYYQDREKQTIDRINAREDEIISDFLTVYEDFIRAKDAYEKEGGNVDNLNGIIKNMKFILGNYEVKPIPAEGKFDPKLHQVVDQVEDDSKEEGTIVKEIAKGYIIRGEILKYSKVYVSKKLIKK